MLQPVELIGPDGIAEMFEKSYFSPVLLYKHSVSCPISGYAWYEVQDCLADDENHLLCYRVTVQMHPEISRELADALDVVHHTPQLIIVREGSADYVASHWHIRKQALQRALTQMAADDAGAE